MSKILGSEDGRLECRGEAAPRAISLRILTIQSASNVTSNAGRLAHVLSRFYCSQAKRITKVVRLDLPCSGGISFHFDPISVGEPVLKIFDSPFVLIRRFSFKKWPESLPENRSEFSNSLRCNWDNFEIIRVQYGEEKFGPKLCFILSKSWKRSRIAREPLGILKLKSGRQLWNFGGLYGEEKFGTKLCLFEVTSWKQLLHAC